MESVKGYEPHDLTYGLPLGFCVEDGQERKRGVIWVRCFMVLVTTSLCSGKDGDKWTGLRLILEVESRPADGLDVRATEK